jgi:FixJ family two-component response regulator
MTTAPIVFIIDDDAAVRDSLSLLCETADLEVECHESPESFLRAYRPERTGCLILDVRMGRMSGPELHAELNRRGSQLPIIYLTAYGDIPMTVRAMKAGAADFLTKPVDGALLLERVRAALRQHRDLLAQQEKTAAHCRRLALLTPREREVMMHALSGYASKTIAKRLGISHRTVEIHRARVLQKTGTSNMLELAQLAADCGLTGKQPSPSSRV